MVANVILVSIEILMIKKHIMEDFNEIIKSKKPTLVDFYATWCGPCKLQSPILDDVKKHIGDEATILKIDVDANKRLAAQYNVRSIPTLIIFRDGEPAWRGVGLHQAAQLVEKIHELSKMKSEDMDS